MSDPVNIYNLIPSWARAEHVASNGNVKLIVPSSIGGGGVLHCADVQEAEQLLRHLLVQVDSIRWTTSGEDERRNVFPLGTPHPVESVKQSALERLAELGRAMNKAVGVPAPVVAKPGARVTRPLSEKFPKRFPDVAQSARELLFYSLPANLQRLTIENAHTEALAMNLKEDERGIAPKYEWEPRELVVTDGEGRLLTMDQIEAEYLGDGAPIDRGMCPMCGYGPEHHAPAGDGTGPDDFCPTDDPDLPSALAWETVQAMNDGRRPRGDIGAVLADWQAWGRYTDDLPVYPVGGDLAPEPEQGF